ncbi:hypothetical protein BS50DRAFT_674944 [Corynespora cassiicola Philippines]|uniref:Uncharacterized protein n=1 Tax=Corynespora cassiicola Philippines TaxID=1448308 RepID=A0A2T2NTE9_CORCC|nr:hypothetical protein BS50DRAFT_674944 [Corynespora cassiicola Philippines]
MALITSLASVPVIFAPLLFSHSASADVLGCQQVPCPVDSSNRTQCKLGDDEIGNVGIVNVSTIVDLNPFTWTIASVPNTTAELGYDQKYFLGTPKSTNLTGITGCAIFFDYLADPVGNEDLLRQNAVTCPDVLSDQCISDLTSQVEKTAEDKKGEDNDAEFCNKLLDKVVKTPPASCSEYGGSPWEHMAVRPLTGPTAANKTVEGECHPTTGKDYNLFEIITRTPAKIQDYKAEDEQVAVWQRPVVPIMTVFREGEDIEANLACVKPIMDTTNYVSNSTGEGDEDESGAAGIPSPSILYMAFAGIALFSMI